MAFKRNKPSSPLGGHLSSRFAGTKKPIRKRAIFGAVMILVVPYLGSTLAASVTISGANSSSAIEFAQGSQVTVACDTSIATALDSSFYSSGPYFKVDKIILSGLNSTDNLSSTTSNQGCGQKSLIVTVYTSSGLAIIGSNDAKEVKVTISTNGTGVTVATSPVNSDISATIATTSANNVFTSEITMTLPSLGSPLNASNVTRVGIETS